MRYLVHRSHSPVFVTLDNRTRERLHNSFLSEQRDHKTLAHRQETWHRGLAKYTENGVIMQKRGKSDAAPVQRHAIRSNGMQTASQFTCDRRRLHNLSQETLTALHMHRKSFLLWNRHYVRTSRPKFYASVMNGFRTKKKTWRVGISSVVTIPTRILFLKR